jgi:Uma2 family endonuclease
MSYDTTASAPFLTGVDFCQRLKVMAAPVSNNYVPIEVYLRSTYEPDAEYVDGQIEERPAALLDHSSWQAAILFWFHPHEREWNIKALPSLRTRTSQSRIRVPDVAVLNRNQPKEQIITHPPIAVFEILSPEDTMTRVLRKLSDYAAMGIPHIWVIDPENGKSHRFLDKKLTENAQFGEPGEPIHFAIEEIKKLLD